MDQRSLDPNYYPEGKMFVTRFDFKKVFLTDWNIRTISEGKTAFGITDQAACAKLGKTGQYCNGVEHVMRDRVRWAYSVEA